MKHISLFYAKTSSSKTQIIKDVVFVDKKATLQLNAPVSRYSTPQLTLGKPKEKSGEFDEKGKARPQKPFIWLHVNILREYLEAEMFVPGMSFQFDLERAIDDWVFMCFFVGNDFLPHLPSLDIRENAIDT